MNNGHVKIDKGMPLPPLARGVKAKYPFAQVKVGDSFLFDKGVSYQSARTYAYTKGRQLKRKFSTRLIDGRVRVWRVA